MPTGEHPGDEIILEYLNAPETEAFAGFRLHLVACAYCRRRTDTTALLRQQGEWLETGDVDDPDPRLAELVAGRLQDESASELRDQIKQDPARLRAALHYASHAQAMATVDAPRMRPESSGRRIASKLSAWLNLRAPIWQMAPALVLLLGISLIVVDRVEREQVRVVTFPDQTDILFYGLSNQTGIGFFAQPGSNTMPFDGMRVELLDDRRIRLKWPEIGEGTVYKLKLQVFRGGGAEVLSRQTLNQSMTELVFDQPLTRHRYEWVLSGETGDSRLFQLSGGFVISDQ